MSDKINKIIFIGIFFCLLIIAMKPTPKFDSSFPPSLAVDVSNEKVFQIGESKIAIVQTNVNSGFYGDLFIVEFDEETNMLQLVGKYNYKELLNTP